MKEKCVYLRARREGCDRCVELGRRCTSHRVVQKAGRKPRAKLALPATSPIPSGSFDSGNELPAPPTSIERQLSLTDSILSSGTLEPFEENLLRRLQSDDINEFVKLLVIGPNFEEQLDKDLRKLLHCGFEGAIDGYLACMGALGLKMGLMEDGNLESSIRRGALAVSKLRSGPDPSPSDLDNWITLGLSIVTFAMTALGTGATTVRRHVLRHAASLPDLSEKMKTSDSLICMTVFETWECLVKRSIPLIKLENAESIHVDRLFGITSGLLQYFYDVCELSHALHHADESDRADIMDALKIVEQRIELWQPCLPQNFISNFTTPEVVQMLCNAEVHKIAALLFIHRLRNHFGSEDDVAERLSRRILTELQRGFNVTQDRVRCVSLPFFLAAIDIRSKAERLEVLELIIEHIDPTCPIVQKQFRVFINAMWQIKDVSTGIFWLDLVPHLPPITMTT
jgi:hypothetical protein